MKLYSLGWAIKRDYFELVIFIFYNSIITIEIWQYCRCWLVLLPANIHLFSKKFVEQYIIHTIMMNNAYSTIPSSSVKAYWNSGTQILFFVLLIVVVRFLISGRVVLYFCWGSEGKINTVMVKDMGSYPNKMKRYWTRNLSFHTRTVFVGGL